MLVAAVYTVQPAAATNDYTNILAEHGEPRVWIVLVLFLGILYRAYVV
jgi:hypothetical protein